MFGDIFWPSRVKAGSALICWFIVFRNSIYSVVILYCDAYINIILYFINVGIIYIWENKANQTNNDVKGRDAVAKWKYLFAGLNGRGRSNNLRHQK